MDNEAVPKASPLYQYKMQAKGSYSKRLFIHTGEAILQGGKI